MINSLALRPHDVIIVLVPVLFIGQLNCLPSADTSQLYAPGIRLSAVSRVVSHTLTLPDYHQDFVGIVTERATCTQVAFESKHYEEGSKISRRFPIHVRRTHSILQAILNQKKSPLASLHLHRLVVDYDLCCNLWLSHSGIGDRERISKLIRGFGVFENGVKKVIPPVENLWWGLEFGESQGHSEAYRRWNFYMDSDDNVDMDGTYTQSGERMGFRALEETAGKVQNASNSKTSDQSYIRSSESDWGRAGYKAFEESAENVERTSRSYDERYTTSFDQSDSSSSGFEQRSTRSSDDSNNKSFEQSNNKSSERDKNKSFGQSKNNSSEQRNNKPSEQSTNKPSEQSTNKSSEQSNSKSSEQSNKTSSEQRTNKPSEQSKSKSSEQSNKTSSEQRTFKSSEQRNSKSSEQSKKTSSEQSANKSSEQRTNKSSEQSKNKSSENETFSADRNKSDSNPFNERYKKSSTSDNDFERDWFKMHWKESMLDVQFYFRLRNCVEEKYRHLTLDFSIQGSGQDLLRSLLTLLADWLSGGSVTGWGGVHAFMRRVDETLSDKS